MIHAHLPRRELSDRDEDACVLGVQLGSLKRTYTVVLIHPRKERNRLSACGGFFYFFPLFFFGVSRGKAFLQRAVEEQNG